MSAEGRHSTPAASRRWTRVAGILLGSVVLVAFGFAAYGASGKEAPTLYERLGGVKTIAPMMDDLIDRLYVNPTINANPTVQAIHLKLHPSVAKFMFTEYFCQSTGGPCTYTGRSMQEAHAHLAISEAEWGAMLEELSQTFDKFKINERERRELTALVDHVKADIVLASKGK